MIPVRPESALRAQKLSGAAHFALTPANFRPTSLTRHDLHLVAAPPFTVTSSALTTTEGENLRCRRASTSSRLLRCVHYLTLCSRDMARTLATSSVRARLAHSFMLARSKPTIAARIAGPFSSLAHRMRLPCPDLELLLWLDLSSRGAEPSSQSVVPCGACVYTRPVDLRSECPAMFRSLNSVQAPLFQHSLNTSNPTNPPTHHQKTKT
jgi:hypothetical protein